MHAQHLEARDRYKEKYAKGKKQINALSKKGDKKDKIHCSHCDIDDHTNEKYWKLHPKLTPSYFKRWNQKKNALISKEDETKEEPREIETSSDIDEKITYMGVKASSSKEEEEK